MRLRPMSSADLPACVTINYASFIDDAFTATLAPYRREYPLAWRRATFERTRKRLRSPGSWATVCVEDREGGGNPAEEEIMGYAVWIRYSLGASSRYGDDSPYLHNNRDLATRFERLLCTCEDEFNWHLRSNQAIDHHINAMFRTGGGVPLWDPLGDRWELVSIAVASMHRRKGVGAKLVAWGLDRCREEGLARNLPPLPATLIASREGHPLYTNLGFKIAAWLGEEFNNDSGAAMVWDESREWTKAVEGRASKGGKVIDIVIRGGQEEREWELAMRAAEESQGGPSGKEGTDVVNLDDPTKDGKLAMEAISQVAA